LIANGRDPALTKGAGPRTALPTNDHPIDAVQVDRTEVFEKRFYGEKSSLRRCGAEVVYAGHAVLAVFNTDAPPNVGSCRNLSERTGEHRREAVAALRQNLKYMPARQQHDLPDGNYVLV